MDQKISTGLGTAIILVMAFTAGYFVWVIERYAQESGDSFQESVTTRSTIKDDVSTESNTVSKSDDMVDIVKVGVVTKTSDNWNTYSNSNVGLSIGYPSKYWSVDESENPIKIWHYSKSINLLDSYIEISTSNNSALNEFNAFNKCNDGFDPFCNQEVEIVKIGGQKAYKAITGYEGSPATTYYVDKKSGSITLTLSGFQSGCERNQSINDCLCKDDAQCTQLENKILSSIRLNEPTWVVYDDSNVRFQYPKTFCGTFWQAEWDTNSCDEVWEVERTKSSKGDLIKILPAYSSYGFEFGGDIEISFVSATEFNEDMENKRLEKGAPNGLYQMYLERGSKDYPGMLLNAYLSNGTQHVIISNSFPDRYPRYFSFLIDSIVLK